MHPDELEQDLPETLVAPPPRRRLGVRHAVALLVAAAIAFLVVAWFYPLPAHPCAKTLPPGVQARYDHAAHRIALLGRAAAAAAWLALALAAAGIVYDRGRRRGYLVAALALLLFTPFCVVVGEVPSLRCIFY